jgi:hypothetical protein
VAASLPFATAACAETAGTATLARTSPRATLIASVQEIQETSFRFKIKGAGVTASGSVDAPTDSAVLKANYADEALGAKFILELLIVGDDKYMKLDFGDAAIPGFPPPDKWQHLDETKIKDKESLELDVAGDADPAGTDDILDAVVVAEHAGDRRYEGTVDLSGVTDAGLLDDEVVGRLGDAAKTVPFEATLDGERRLVNLKLRIPSVPKVKAQVWEITYSDYGAAPKLRKPRASNVQEAPSQIYELLNS